MVHSRVLFLLAAVCIILVLLVAFGTEILLLLPKTSNIGKYNGLQEAPLSYAHLKQEILKLFMIPAKEKDAALTRQPTLRAEEKRSVVPGVKDNIILTTQDRSGTKSVDGDEFYVTCQPTLRAEARRSVVPGVKDNIILTTQDRSGTKSVGGDEFYVTLYRHDGDTTGTSQVQVGMEVAVGHVTDLGTGEYNIDFHKTANCPDGSADSPKLEDFHPFILRAVLQYSCGLGKLSPPSKLDWPNGKSIKDIVLQMPVDWFPTLADDSAVKPMKLEGGPFNIVALGDSLMNQLLFEPQQQSYPAGGVTRGDPSVRGQHYTQAALATGTVQDHFINQLSQLNVWLGNAPEATSRQKLVLLGSCERYPSSQTLSLTPTRNG